MGQPPDKPSPTTTAVEAFVHEMRRLPAVRPEGRARLLFALDATASRQPTWDRACHIQAEMFAVTAALGGLDVQLAYYRGFHEFRATPWVSSARGLVGHMTGVTCRAGRTQLERVLHHAVAEARSARLQALVFVGDCFEEDAGRVAAVAGELGLLGVPAFMFEEGKDPVGAEVFRAVARLTKGAYCQLDAA
ncbi:MAG: VWA domain-containing protein, partial [Alphaproteobacteria bacterium]|nr:VWA domain-containing protein [Alphaproteobacteria bacterium]